MKVQHSFCRSVGDAPSNWARRLVIGSVVLSMGAGIDAREPLPMPPGGRPWRIGWLSGGSGPDDPAYRPTIDIVVRALHDKGWRLGQDYVIGFRFVAGDARRYPALADELIVWRPDVLYALETGARVLVTKTKTIPIVLATSIDPIGAGLIMGLQVPGTNVTGMTGLSDAIAAKQVELLAELLPGATRIALLFDQAWAGGPEASGFAEQAARARGLALTLAPVSDEDSVHKAVRQMVADGVNGVVVFPSPGIGRLGSEIGAALRRARLPVVGGNVPHPMLVPVIDFGQDLMDQFRQSADFVDQIFRGAKPANLPVRQATRFVLNVNLKAARELGIEVPRAILLRADRVIE